MKLILSFACLLVVLVAFDASAQCKYCDLDAYSYCLTCYDTTYNAAVLCTLYSNGTVCRLQGACDGPSGECRGCVINRTELRPRNLKLAGDWQLVSVEIKKTPPRAARVERRRHS